MTTTLTVEALALALHNAGREAVEQGLVVNKIPGQGFLEWDELPEHAKEGSRTRARHLLGSYIIYPKVIFEMDNERKTYGVYLYSESEQEVIQLANATHDAYLKITQSKLHS